MEEAAIEITRHLIADPKRIDTEKLLQMMEQPPNAQEAGLSILRLTIEMCMPTRIALGKGGESTHSRSTRIILALKTVGSTRSKRQLLSSRIHSTFTRVVSL